MRVWSRNVVTDAKGDASQKKHGKRASCLVGIISCRPTGYIEERERVCVCVSV